MDSETEPGGTPPSIAASLKKKKVGKRDTAKKAGRFPIVGIGSSAGGLEALEQFLGHVPEKSGMAFVIVQHLDPTHKGIMPELLQRVTKMTVLQVQDNTVVVPDHVYVIPPNRDLSLLHGTLYLLEPAAPRGLRLPIDFFFRSLAEDQQDQSIGVILSGMGSDGTLGLLAIKEKAGMVFVQEPSSAKFDGMPRSAIDAGAADIIAPVEELPEKILACIGHRPALIESEPAIQERTLSSLAKVLILLREYTGHDFSLYKKSMVYRRIERRMAVHQVGEIASYVRFLRENPGERELLFKELLIGVTGFFRDKGVWDFLRDSVFPEMIRKSPAGTTLRAWIAGCSTGEEAYSLAIVFREALDQVKDAGTVTLQIYATDLDREAIDKARQGVFSRNITNDVSPERLGRFFMENGDKYRIRGEIREMVIFAVHNLIGDPPFTKMDLLCCRNLLIYLEPALQAKLLPLFFYVLNPGGTLVLGSAETIGTFSNLFTPQNSALRVYRGVEQPSPPEPVEFPFSLFPRVSGGRKEQPPVEIVRNIQALAEKVLLTQFSPPAVLTNASGDILYLNGRTGNYLEPPTGKANWNIFAMAREGLRHDLVTAFQKAVREGGTVTVRNLPVRTDTRVLPTDCTVQVIREPKALAGQVMIVFSDTAVLSDIRPAEAPHSRSRGRDKRVSELEAELRENAEELQTLREEMQSSQEELKSANEEMQSANEELQSTNEELTTSKEEMQSMNEELQTVNAELQSRVDDFTRINDDMANLLNSTDIGTVFLDNALHIRGFTSQAMRIIPFIQGDIGRPVADIKAELLYPELVQDGRKVLETLVPVGKEVMTRDEHWFQVRMIPYRTLANKIDGVVISFVDITAAKQVQRELGTARAFADAVIATIREPLLVLDPAMKIMLANHSFCRMFKVSREETEGKDLYSLGNNQWNIPALRRLLEQILPENFSFENYTVHHIFPDIGDRTIVLNARRVIFDDPSLEYILLAFEDVTGRMRGGPDGLP